MTLKEYKRQVNEIKEVIQNFKGPQEEAIKFFEDLARKYPQVNEFNKKAMECKDLKEFKKLADTFGMKFSSDESAEKLFSMLQEGKRQIEEQKLRYENGGKLSDGDLAAVTGGDAGDKAAAIALSLISPLGGFGALLVDGIKGAKNYFDTIGEYWNA